MNINKVPNFSQTLFLSTICFWYLDISLSLLPDCSCKVTGHFPPLLPYLSCHRAVFLRTVNQSKFHFLVVAQMRNDPHTLMYLNIWSLLVVLFGGCYGGVTLMEKVHHWGWMLGVHSFTLCPVHSFWFVIAIVDDISQLSALSPCFRAFPPFECFLWNHKPK